MSQLLPATALVFNAFIWGVSWWPFRALQDLGVHPLWATALAYLLAVLCLLLWRPAALRALFSHPQLWWLLLAAGLCNAGFNWAVTTGDVVRVVLLFYLMPAWSVLLAWPLLGERPGLAALARLALALAGVLVVLKQPGTPWPVPTSLPDWLALGAGFSFALTNILLLRLKDTPPSGRMLAMFGGGALLAGGVALLGQTAGLVNVPPAPGLGWLLLTAALGLALVSGNIALQYGAARLPANATALIMLSEVVFASLSSVALGAAQLDGKTLLGAGLIGLAVLLASLAEPAASAKEKTP
ncbi:MAG: DMT family transporter [Pseudomonadota bacterium]